MLFEQRVISCLLLLLQVYLTTWLANVNIKKSRYANFCTETFTTFVGNGLSEFTTWIELGRTWQQWWFLSLSHTYEILELVEEEMKIKLSWFWWILLDYSSRMKIKLRRLQFTRSLYLTIEVTNHVLLFLLCLLGKN
jgi:hypothetical protein